MCQPPKANRPAATARRKSAALPAGGGAAASAPAGAPSAKPAAIMTPMAATLPAVKSVCRRLPWRTPT